MVDLIGREHESAAADPIPDRRRPGRVDYESPHLIALLRRQLPPDADEPRPDTAPDAGLVDFGERRDRDDMSAGMGVSFAAVLGAVAWVGLISGLLLLFAR